MNTKDIVQAYNADARTNAIRKVVEQMVSEWIDLGMFRSCLNCEHWNGEKHKLHPETCRVFNNQRPPARIIVTGCSEHSDNIPF